MSNNITQFLDVLNKVNLKHIEHIEKSIDAVTRLTNIISILNERIAIQQEEKYKMIHIIKKCETCKN